MAHPLVTQWSGTDVDVTSIDRHLAHLWKQLVQEDPSTCPVRTAVFNLVVYTESDQQAEDVCRSLEGLSHRQPSRTIVLVADRYHPRPTIDAEASVSCLVGSGNRLNRGYEQVVVHARGRVADHLASVVIPLELPELPTYLWWPGQPPFGHRSLHRLLEVADQLIIDSAQFSTPGDGIALVAELTTAKQGVSDFNWSRLSPWRELVAQFFDGQSMAPYARAIRAVRLEFGAGAASYPLATAGTLLLLGWAAARLAWEPETTMDGVLMRDIQIGVLQGGRFIPIDIQFRDHGAEAAGYLMAMDIVSQPKAAQPARFRVSRHADNLGQADVSLQVHGEGEIQRTVLLGLRSDVEILADELEKAGHDPEYEEVVRMASIVAGREIRALA